MTWLNEDVILRYLNLHPCLTSCLTLEGNFNMHQFPNLWKVGNRSVYLGGILGVIQDHLSLHHTLQLELNKS